MNHVCSAIVDLDDNLEKGKSVLVFCEHGSRRSVFLVSCYLKLKSRARVTSVYGSLKLLRSVINPECEANLRWASQWLSLPGWTEAVTRETSLPIILNG